LYHRDYWIPAGCHKLRSAAAMAHFEAAVNCGVGTAVRLLQKAIGVTADGAFGPITQAHTEWYAPADLAFMLCRERLRYYRDLARNSRLRPNLLAWTDRIVKFHQRVLNDPK